MANIFMLALMAGRERTLREFETLLNSSGFRLDKVIDVGLGTSILEASAINSPLDSGFCSSGWTEMDQRPIFKLELSA
jgi:hypothetical protein